MLKLERDKTYVNGKGEKWIVLTTAADDSDKPVVAMNPRSKAFRWFSLDGKTLDYSSRECDLVAEHREPRSWPKIWLSDNGNLIKWDPSDDHDELVGSGWELISIQEVLNVVP